jgi:hypothetical protein
MAEEAVITAPVEAPPEPAGEPPAAPLAPAPEPAAEPHPLEPGGKRFNEVYARAKAAEGKLQAEREERIRLEERLKAQQDVAQVKADATKPAEHSWETLESWIAEGKLSRAQAMAYREGIIEERSIAKATAKLDAQLKETQRTTTVTGELERYKQALPAITQPGTPERVKVETQYSYLINTLGHQPGLATELLASKLAFGDAEILEKQRTTQRATADQHEVMMETHSTTRPAETTAKDKHDPVAKLDARQREHYERMIKAGRYNDWGEVRKELAWERKR